MTDQAAPEPVSPSDPEVGGEAREFWRTAVDGFGSWFLKAECGWTCVGRTPDEVQATHDHHWANDHKHPAPAPHPDAALRERVDILVYRIAKRARQGREYQELVDALMEMFKEERRVAVERVMGAHADEALYQMAKTSLEARDASK